ITTLQGIAFDEGRLQRVEFFAAGEAFDRGDLFAGTVGKGCDAGAGCLAVDEDGAGAAFPFAAAVFAAGEREIVAEDAEERAARIGGTFALLSIQLQASHCHRLIPDSKLGSRVTL